MTKNLKYIALWLLVTLLASACSKDGADGNEVTNRNEAKKEIGIKPDVWKMAEATRATTYDNTALQSDGFTVYAYTAESITPYIDNKTVSYDAPNWIITGRPYYWPAYNLDFFAYAPATLPSYIAADPALTYTAAHNVTFTCSGLPMTNAGQGSDLKEFMFGMALGQNGENAGSGVPLQFQHPFARIKLQLAASHPNVTINSITFRSIYNNGSYNHSASPKWSTSGDATNFVLSLTGGAADFDNNPASERQIGDYYIMIPQNWGGEIVVNADCLYWGEKKNYPSLTTTVPTDWQPGYSYTYTFSISPDDLKVGTTSQFTEQW